MNRKIDLEESLKGLDCGPGGHVKKNVMEAYAAAFRSGGAQGIWHKSVPLYQAAAAAILIAVLSGLSGGLLVKATSNPTVASSAGLYADSLALVTLKPASAPGDALR